jgi:hypothetical protein
MISREVSSLAAHNRLDPDETPDDRKLSGFGLFWIE